METIKAFEQNEHVCYKCLKVNPENEINIHQLGYGSSFDGCDTKVEICNECIDDTLKEWFELETVYDTPEDEENGFCRYKFEEEILDWISELDIRVKELFHNRYSSDGYNMTAQDWIDYQLGILPYEKCKEYGYYAPEEISAYQDRFPVCGLVEIKVYEDSSRCAKCFLGAYGNVVDGEIKTSSNISTECHRCTHFKRRDGDIKMVDVAAEERNREIERLNRMIEFATKRLEEIEN